MKGKVKSKVEFRKNGGGREKASYREWLRLGVVLGKLEKEEETYIERKVSVVRALHFTKLFNLSKK